MTCLAPLGRSNPRIPVKFSRLGLDGAGVAEEDGAGPTNRIPPGRTTLCGAQGLCCRRFGPSYAPATAWDTGLGRWGEDPIVGSRVHSRERAVSDCQVERARRIKLPAHFCQPLQAASSSERGVLCCPRPATASARRAPAERGSYRPGTSARPSARRYEARSLTVAADVVRGGVNQPKTRRSPSPRVS